MRCSYVLENGMQCPNKTKIKNAKCWKKWGLCGVHAAMLHPKEYPNRKGHKTGGRFGLNKSNNAISLVVVNEPDEEPVHEDFAEFRHGSPGSLSKFSKI